MLIVENIEKSFGGNHVLRGISFKVEEGKIYGLIGRNGAGKTTLINIMAGISSPDAGMCRINDTEITGLNNMKLIGYLPDLPNYYEYLTCGEYLDFLLMEKQSTRRKKLLDLVELSPDTKIATMSRGMRQRLGIAAAIAGDPEVVLLDEPTSALDPGGRAEVTRILSDLRDSGRTVVLSTHILADMEKVCDQVGFLSGGVIRKSLDVAELDKGGNYISVSLQDDLIEEKLLKAYDLPYEILGNRRIRFSIKNDFDCRKQKALFRMLAGVDVRIESIHSEVGSLEKIYQEVCK